ncbi:MAG TPA: ATP-binding cassette domain-containing protein [Clostridia bacterium]|nr:ATP-binding cassette domain-containing protein [Clostridia bacterium]
MAIISIKNLILSFGGPPLLDGLELHIESGDKLCLLGKNGTGKSTLLKLMAGLLEPDSGEVVWEGGVKTAYLRQEFPDGAQGRLIELVTDGNPERSLAAEQALSLLGLDPEQELSTMSGGEQRRAYLARVLAVDAEVLLLDEPTNHLDIDTIRLLEDYLLRRVKTVIFVTHDRSFAKRLSNRVAEIDRGQVYAFRTSYKQFLERREELLDAEAKKRAEFDKRLAQEEAWLRRGVKARRTRNEGRVRALQEMRDQYRQRREQTGKARMEIHNGGRSGNLVIEAKNISFGYGEESDGESSSEAIIDNFTTTIMRRDRVGIVGPNGSGKTTLLKLLLKELEPQKGTIRHGVNLQPVYFDQMRSELDPDKNVIENLGDGYETIELNGRKKHIMAYLQDFLFSPDRAKSPVAHLSGGERNRLLLAKLFARPANLLILDEPTNDLDVETLELLEDLLQEYQGTILLVSHDRTFLDNVVTDCFVLAGRGRVIEYAGGYADWEDSELRRKTEEQQNSKDVNGKGGQKTLKDNKDEQSAVQKRRARKPKTEKPRTLSYKERQELENLPDTIIKIEAEIERIHNELADPELYRSAQGSPASLTATLKKVESDLEVAYRRWEELQHLEDEASP